MWDDMAATVRGVMTPNLQPKFGSLTLLFTVAPAHDTRPQVTQTAALQGGRRRRLTGVSSSHTEKPNKHTGCRDAGEGRRQERMQHFCSNPNNQPATVVFLTREWSKVDHKAQNKSLLSSDQGAASVLCLTPASMDRTDNSCHGDSSSVQSAWCAACNHTVPDGNVDAAILKSDAAHYTLVRPCCSPHAHLVLH